MGDTTSQPYQLRNARSHDNRIYAPERPDLTSAKDCLPSECFTHRKYFTKVSKTCQQFCSAKLELNKILVLYEFVQYAIRRLQQTPHQLDVMDVATGATSRDVLALIMVANGCHMRKFTSLQRYTEWNDHFVVDYCTNLRTIAGSSPPPQDKRFIHTETNNIIRALQLHSDKTDRIQ